jgi:ribonuclease E
MVQEESMKDNTAAVHVQVPVEVTSFLLNEKRTEITKIELKQRVTVLLVPNKHLETPNYKLERLRHDDPRLEGLQASYTMIEEPDDEVGITRREKSKPKQEPIIKGVLPDMPAPPAPPPAAPKPVAPPPARAPVAAVAPPPASAAAGSGFFSWVKKLFGGEPAPAPVAKAAAAPVAAAAPAAAAPEKRDGRRGERGGRGERGERGGERGRGRGDQRDGRGRKDAPAEGAPAAEGREERAPRPERAERPERTERGERNDRGERGGENRRGPRPERAPRAEAAPVDVQQQAFVDTMPLAELPGAAPAEGEREGGRRRRRRGGRDRGEGRGEETGLPVTEGDNAAPAADVTPADAVTTEAPEGAAAEGTEGGEREGGEREGGEREGGRRRGRGRDRFRREQREGETETAGDNAEPAPTGMPVAAEAVMDIVVAPPPPAAPTPVAPVMAAAPVVPVAAPVAAAPVRIERYVLPTESLGALATEAGLQWVHSDADKISAVQAAMAAEPKPVHVPRAPKPPVVIDEGPLVLVETRKDLSQLKLPFEQSAAP